MPQKSFDFDYFGLLFGSSWENTTSVQPLDEGVIKAMNLGAFVKFYNSDRLAAPIGVYHQLGFDMIRYTITYEPFGNAFRLPDDYDPSNNPFTPTTIPIEDSYMSFMVDYVVGAQRVFMDRLVLRVAGQFGYVFGGFKGTDLGSELAIDLSGSSSRVDIDNYMRRYSQGRLFSYNAISIKFGVSYLLF